jgi:DNA-binding beta-propeller fold protein YncE
MIGPRALYVQDRGLWVALREGHSVWRIDLDSGIIHHVAGTGKKGFTGDEKNALAGTFNGPKGIVAQGNRVFVVDTENQAIRMIDTATHMLSTISGPKTQASLGRPHGICVDASGKVYVGDTENNRVVRLRPLIDE